MLEVPSAARRWRVEPLILLKLPPTYTRLAVVAMAYTVPSVFACHLRSLVSVVDTAARWRRDFPEMVVKPPPM